MERDISGLKGEQHNLNLAKERMGPPLPLSCLRLLVPPLGLVSAAIWQTVHQKVVTDYGMLEEFVSMVTEIVPELLTRRQRAELVLGLRARLILELCRSEATADLQVIQPHLDRMRSLRALFDIEMDDADVDKSDLHFMGVVESLLRDPEERENFFREVFPEEFGPMYDKAIQTLMCHFLNRLEKLIPAQTIQQVASLLCDAPSFLEECMESVSHPEELRTLLEYQKDLSPLQDNDISVEGTRIMSALVLPPVERVVIVSEQTQTGTDALGGYVYTACTEMEVESAAMTESKEKDMEGTIEECAEDQQWFYISNDVKSEGDADLKVTEQIEYIEPIDGENGDDTRTAFVRADGVEYEYGDCEMRQNDKEYGVEAETVMIIGEDGTTMPLCGAISNNGDMRKKTKRRMKMRKIQGREKVQKVERDCTVLLERLDMPVPSQSRAVRPNRGLKMKTFLSQRRKKVSQQGRSTGTFSNTQSSSKKADLGQRTCKICGKVVSRAKFLQSHMNRHSTELPYPCSACKRRYKSSRSLQEHRCSSQSLKNRSRSKCSRKVSEETSTIVKERAAEGEQLASGAPCEASDEDLPSDSTARDPSYPGPAKRRSSKTSRLIIPECYENMTEGQLCCPHCSIEFKGKQSFRYHLRNVCFDSQQVDPENVEDNEQCFKCDECGKAFRFKSTLESHKHTHNPLYCEVCMKLVRDSEALAMHKISHTPFQCNKCDESFRVFKALYKHYIDVHNPSGPFTCPHCQETLVSLKRFIRHEWKHTGHQPFQCPNCPKRFRSYSDVQDHQKKHTKEKPFLCWECGKSFRHSITLTRHVGHKHSKPGQPIPEKVPTTVLCTQCDKVFKSRRCLLHHENVHHKGLRYPCSHCGKGFFSKNALVRHTLIHTGERPFKCDECGKTFRSASELKIHMRYHTGERPFKCSICDKGFVQSCFLTLHMRTHTGERPYVCPVCSKRFQSLHCMKRHKKLVHS